MKLNKFINKNTSSIDENLQKSINHLERWGFEKFGDFNDEDIFVIGYPKSGNTLLQHIIAHLVYGLLEDTSKSLINTCVTEYYNNPYFFRLNKRHFFKSHELPKPKFKNVIYIVRDGRAAVRSYYYMKKNMGDKKLSINYCYESGGETFVGNWNDHVKQWTNNPYNAKILYIKYEDLITNKHEQIIRINDFLNLSRSEEDIKNVLNSTSLTNMKKMEKSYSWDRKKGFQSWKKDGEFVREGMKSNYINDDIINQDSLKRFEEKSHEMLNMYDYL